MKKNSFSVLLIFIVALLLFFKCTNNSSTDSKTNKDSAAVVSTQFGGYESQVKYGEHLVSIAGCNDCHTPKKMGASGPEPDFSIALSGHPTQAPIPDINIKEIQSKALGVTNDLTVWIGAWGISYAANITSDSTGIGNWKEDQFLKCIREGKFKGLDGERPLMPPMPWEDYKTMTDDELKAVFAYLKSTNPIHNIVPEYQPPLAAIKK